MSKRKNVKRMVPFYTYNLINQSSFGLETSKLAIDIGLLLRISQKFNINKIEAHDFFTCKMVPNKIELQPFSI